MNTRLYDHKPVDLPEVLSSESEHDTLALQSSRRRVIRLAAGSSAFALVASRWGSQAVIAQESSPAAVQLSEDRYVVIRNRTVRANVSIDELNDAIRDGLVPLIAAIPGFIDYYVIQDEETRQRTAVTIFTDKAGADESTTVASDFLANEGLAEYYEDLEPVVLQGAIVVTSH
jgi:hypothetical protein